MTSVSAVESLSILGDKFRSTNSTVSVTGGISAFLSGLFESNAIVPASHLIPLISHIIFDSTTNQSIARPERELLSNSAILDEAHKLVDPANNSDESIFAAMVQHDLVVKMPPKSVRHVRVRITQRIKGSPVKSDSDDLI